MAPYAHLKSSADNEPTIRPESPKTILHSQINCDPLTDNSLRHQLHHNPTMKPLLLYLPYFPFILSNPLSPPPPPFPNTLALTNPPPSPLKDTQKYHCEDPWFVFSSPSKSNCLSAVHRLPPTTSTGTFHTSTSAPYDPFLLPVWVIVGDCKVKVELAYLSQDTGSWTEVKRKAEWLVRTCSEEGYEHKTKGGWVVAGRREGVRIVVGKYRWEGEGVRDI
ncbi:MAG: hypothetical protein Q9219_005886 [cf. Caloplaca sp. 3 TL-2023]